MARVRQKRVALAMVENIKALKPKGITEILESVGYPKSSAYHNQKIIVQSKGVQEELKILGFDEQTAKEVVGSILVDETNEPKDRLKAADMVFDVFGAYAPEKHINLNVGLNANDEALEEAAKVYGIAAIKRKLS